MEKKFDQVKYQNQYIREKYDRLSLLLPRGTKDKIKERAAQEGLSVNAYILKMLKL